MNYIDLIGFTAGTLATISFVPQVVQTLKTKSAKDISLKMYLLFCSGVFLWLVYGILIMSVPVIAANVVTFILALFVLVMKIRYG